MTVIVKCCFHSVRMSQVRPEDRLLRGGAVLGEDAVDWVVPLHGDGGRGHGALLLGRQCGHAVPVVDGEAPLGLCLDIIQPVTRFKQVQRKDNL